MRKPVVERACLGRKVYSGPRRALAPPLWPTDLASVEAGWIPLTPLQSSGVKTWRNGQVGWGTAMFPAPLMQNSGYVKEIWRERQASPPGA